MYIIPVNTLCIANYDVCGTTNMRRCTIVGILETVQLPYTRILLEVYVIIVQALIKHSSVPVRLLIIVSAQFKKIVELFRFTLVFIQP